jgi:hypothetical protein
VHPLHQEWASQLSTTGAEQMPLANDLGIDRDVSGAQ